jgi:RNA polymerase primary sigma factor
VTTREESEEEVEGENELVEVQQPPVLAKSGAKEPAERTDDPVRMYLREMGSVELLSREDEIAIAKRIEAGREAMIAGLCESPLTFQAIIIWRDELNEGKVFLRDIVDLDATYAGPNAKAMLAPMIGPDGQLVVGIAVPSQPWQPPAVCTENSIRIDLVTESLSVREDDCAVMLLPGAGHIAVQVEDPT